MSKAIVICTTPKTTHWLNNLLESFKGYDKFPIIILSDFGYELGKINFIQNCTNITEFFLLQDTVEIKDPSIFEKGFTYAGSVAWDSTFKSYLGKYRREILDKCHLPTPKTKMDSITFEVTFNLEYLTNETKKWFIHEEFTRSGLFENKFDRHNMIIEDEYIKKYKHIWNHDLAYQLGED